MTRARPHPSGASAPAPPENTADFTGLDAGTHTVLVRAVDRASTPTPRPSSYTWTVVGPPVVTVTGGPADGSVTTDTSTTFDFIADQVSVSFVCTFDGVPAGCTSPVSYADLEVGGHSFEVSATNGLRPRLGPAGQPRLDDRRAPREHPGR